VTIDQQDPVQRLDDEMTGLWRQVGELIRGQARLDVRMGRMETDVSVLKTDVSVLKTDVAELKTDVAELKTNPSGFETDVSVLKASIAASNEKLDRLERTTESRFNRVDAQLERLIAHVVRAETKS
jgi:chromosome segregation ATPase